MYIRNITGLIAGLKDGEVLCLSLRSGKELTIFPQDVYDTNNGDIVINRGKTRNRCIWIIDPAEVEFACLKKGDDL